MLWRKINSVRDGEREASWGSALWICYLPFPVGPQRGSFCLVSLKPQEHAESSSEAKERVILWSENGEVVARILETMLSRTKRQSAGLLHRHLVSGERGALAGLVQAWCCSRASSQRRAQRLCTLPAAAILNRSAGCTASAHAQAEASAQPFCGRHSALKCRLRALCKRFPVSKWRLPQRKERKEKVRLYFITQILFLFNGSC